MAVGMTPIAPWAVVTESSEPISKNPKEPMMEAESRGRRPFAGALSVTLAVIAGALGGVFAGARPTPPGEDAIPRADPPFQGVAQRTLGGSKPDFPRPVAAPRDAPNVLLVLVDDAGFGNPSTFGGPCQTPTLTRLADQGLRYNRFHVTALCSPTRAALLSGRNHHA